MTDRLNPEALEAAAKALRDDHANRAEYYVVPEWNDTSYGQKLVFRGKARAAVSAYLAALPTPRTIEGVYDLGSPEPEGVDHVIECDEHGNPYERDPEGSNDPTWSKTIDGTRWKGYKDGKEYRDWGDLVRRYGPVIDVRWAPTEGGGE